MKKKTNNVDELAKESERLSNAIYDFEILLENSKDLDEKKRFLWKQIYRNAVDDRASAAALFNNAYASMGQTSTDHIAMGATLVKYLEKMSKSNQQLLDLSSLINKDEEQNSKIDPDDLFSKIEGKDA